MRVCVCVGGVVCKLSMASDEEGAPTTLHEKSVFGLCFKSVFGLVFLLYSCLL